MNPKDLGMETPATKSETLPTRHAKKKYVPFHKAKIERRDVILEHGEKYQLTGNRRVEVWDIRGGGIGIRIYKQTDNKKTSELKFGLERDAAIALLFGLNRRLTAACPQSEDSPTAPTLTQNQ